MRNLNITKPAAKAEHTGHVVGLIIVTIIWVAIALHSPYAAAQMSQPTPWSPQQEAATQRYLDCGGHYLSAGTWQCVGGGFLASWMRADDGVLLLGDPAQRMGVNVRKSVSWWRFYADPVIR